MATTPVEITFASGITGMTADLYPLNSTTADQSGMPVTEQTNALGFYRFDVTNAVSGIKRGVLKDSGGSHLGSFFVYIEDDTSVWRELLQAEVNAWRGSQVNQLSGGYVQARSEAGNKLAEEGADSDTLETLSDQLDTVQSKTSQIGSGSVSHVSPVSETGKLLKLVRGDDYTTAANQALDWTDDDGNWPDLTGATIRHTVRLAFDDSQVYQVTGSVVTATGSNKQVRAELTNAETSQLTVGTRKQYFDVEAELSGGDRRTLVWGYVNVVKDSTKV